MNDFLLWTSICDWVQEILQINIFKFINFKDDTLFAFKCHVYLCIY